MPSMTKEKFDTRHWDIRAFAEFEAALARARAENAPDPEWRAYVDVDQGKGKAWDRHCERLIGWKKGT